MKSKEPRRKFSSLMTSVLIIFTALAAVNFTSMNVSAGGHGDHGWSGDVYITGDKTYPESGNDSATITLTDGDLIICDGVTLTFNDNVTFQIYNNDDAGDYGIQVNATANFVVNSVLSNTTIKTHDDREQFTYSFTNSGTIDFLGATVQRLYGDPSAKSTTGGIRNNPGSVVGIGRSPVALAHYFGSSPF